MIEVSIRELKAHLSEYVRRTGGGESVTITRRGKPVAVLTAAEPESELDRKLQGLVAGGVLLWAGSKPRFPKRRVKLRGEGPTISQMVVEDRR